MDSPVRPTSRRRLLALAGGFLAAPLVLRRSTALASTGPTDAAWAALAEMMGEGGLLRRGEPGYREHTRPQNLRWDLDLPDAVVLPRDPQAIGRAILWAREQGMPVAARSGGHSYAGSSAGPGLIVNMRRLDGVRFPDPGGEVVELGGGALNAGLYAALADASRDEDALAIVHGRCSGVGASAFLMGGGIGFAMRHQGFGCDGVVGAELVLADGSIVQCSAGERPDLFWAVRGGGGGNLGIATRWRVRTWRSPPVTVFKAVWRSRQRETLAELFRVLEAAPASTGAKITLIGHPGGIELSVLGQAIEPDGTLENLLAGLLAGADEHQIARLPYWQAQAFLGEAGQPAHYHETSLFVQPLAGNGAALDRLMNSLERHPAAAKGEGAIMKFFQVGGRIGALAPDATAIPYRGDAWIAGTELEWNGQTVRDGRLDRLLDWQRDMHAAMQETLPGARGSYINFPDVNLPDPAAAYYGPNLERLRVVRRTVDPDRIFSPPRRQGIG
ncbi:MAG TPA: FAD-binding protein [Geminicoccus sp.]|uniref:FAD-binding protein n=1 Tax=Geminicoccus sp. TaxID=2024832 RepID=UPI002BEFBD0A|nr:FAD-binding protein [Geminicoccus sp.]HWL67864.1 FAD-binding protein [Geminicoccus sp.]